MSRPARCSFGSIAAPFQAALDNAAANLAAMQKNAARAQAALRASLAGVTRQQATMNFARTNRERFEELSKDGAVSASQRDQAVTEADVAEATIRAAEAQVENDRAAVAAAEAAIDQAEAALKTARINLAYTSITAPISGRIGRSSVTEGALVTAYQPVALATIQQLDPMYVDVPQSTTELLRLRRRLEEGRLNHNGQIRDKVRLLLEDDTKYPLEGALQFRDVTVDPTTGSVILRVVFPNPKGVLLPGMFVRAVVEEGVNEQADPGSSTGRFTQPEGESRCADRGCRGQGPAADAHARSRHRRCLACFIGSCIRRSGDRRGDAKGETRRFREGCSF